MKKYFLFILSKIIVPNKIFECKTFTIYALRVLSILASKRSSAQAIVSSGLLPALYETSLMPLPYKTFVAQHLLERRSQIISEILLECAHPDGFLFLGPRAEDNGPGSVAYKARQAEAMAKRKAESEEEIRKNNQAKQLQEITGYAFSMEYARKAMEMSAGNINRACEYLYSGQVEAFMKGAKEVGGGHEGKDKKRWEMSLEMAQLSNFPPRLCFRALEMFNGHVSSATNWVIDAGGRYLEAFREDDVRF